MTQNSRSEIYSGEDYDNLGISLKKIGDLEELGEKLRFKKLSIGFVPGESLTTLGKSHAKRFKNMNSNINSHIKHFMNQTTIWQAIYSFDCSS